MPQNKVTAACTELEKVKLLAKDPSRDKKLYAELVEHAQKLLEAALEKPMSHKYTNSIVGDVLIAAGLDVQAWADELDCLADPQLEYMD